MSTNEEAAPHGAAIKKRIQLDDVFRKRLYFRFMDEVTPMLKLNGVEDVALPEVLNLTQIIETTDRIIAVENSRFLALNALDYLVPLAPGDLSGGKSRGFLEIENKLIVDSAIKPQYRGSDDDLRTFLTQLKAKVIAITLSYLRVNRYASTIVRGIDMFDSTSSLKLRDQVATFTQPHTAIADRVLSTTGEAVDYTDDVLADMRSHFPELDDFLALLCASRFAPDRRKAFLWIHAPAGWGKGLLMGALALLNLVTEVSEKDVEAAFEGKPLGLDPDEVTKSWALWFDEVKRVKSELKQLNNQITMTPKFQKRTKVPVFLKVFTSAEGIDSLAGENGVESQFADRFCYMAAKGKIEERALFNELGSHTYIKALSFGVAEIIDSYVERMRGLGEAEAYRDAECELAALHDKYRIDKSLGSLEDTLEQYADELTELIRAAAKWNMFSNLQPELAHMSDGLRRKLCSSVSTAYLGKDRTPVTVLKRPASFVKAWISESVDQSEVVKVRLKSNLICEMASDHPLSTHRAYADSKTSVAEVIKGAILLNQKQIATDADNVVSFL